MQGEYQTKRYRKEERSTSYSDILESLASYCDDDSRPASHYVNESSYNVNCPVGQHNAYSDESPVCDDNTNSEDFPVCYNNANSRDSSVGHDDTYIAGNLHKVNNYSGVSHILATKNYYEPAVQDGTIPVNQPKLYINSCSQNGMSPNNHFNYRRRHSYNTVNKNNESAKNVVKNNDIISRNPCENVNDIYSRHNSTSGIQNASVRNTSYSKSSNNINNINIGEDKDLLYKFRRREMPTKEPRFGERSNTWIKLHQDPVESDTASYLEFPPPGELYRAPSQATMHHTTVPQALVSRTLGSRHHPTRSSLRHSRMLVMAKTGTVPRKYLPGVVECLGVGVALYVSQVVFGSLLTGLGAWHLLQTHHTFRTEDLPFHSGILALLSGWVGLILLTCFRYYYPGSDHHTCLYPVRTYHIIVSLVVSVSACLFCLTSGLCHLCHLLTYQASICQVPSPPPGWPVNTCLCLSSWGWQSGQLIYPGTSCLSLATVLPPLLVTLLVLNLLAAASGLASCLLLAFTKHNQTFSAWRNGGPSQAKDGSLSPIIRRMRPRSASML